MFSTVKQVKLSSYLDRASKWNEMGMYETLSKIRLQSRIMPTQNQQKNIMLMDWVNMTTENEKKGLVIQSNQVLYNRSLHFYNNT